MSGDERAALDGAEMTIALLIQKQRELFAERDMLKAENFELKDFLQRNGVSTLRQRVAELEGAITEALAHVEDEEVKRAGNQCTLCFTYRAMLRTTLAKGDK